MAEPERSPEPSDTPPPATLRQAFGAVAWSFFGVRKKSAMSRDVTSVRPQHVIIIGILMAAIFVGTLIVIVRLITAGT